MAMKVFLAVLLPVVLGRDCKFMPFDCSDIYNSGETVSGIYSIYPAGDVPVWVYCHMISDGKAEDNGGWTVIQRRMDGRINFYQPWKEYKRGFGNVESEYWLGDFVFVDFVQYSRAVIQRKFLRSIETGLSSDSVKIQILP